MRGSLIGDAAGWNTCFGLGEEAVVAELSSLRSISALTDAERTLVDARLTQLADTEDIETGCEDFSCPCGSG
ncbi:hypothetical protein JYT20_00220 [Rhodothermus sp. AH-315-K08]|nr:hypothetical protein [Rhodothermus sp. AH-315-K08]